MKTKQTKEFSEQGQVKKDIYIEYAKASNLGAVCVYLVMLLGAQSAQIGTYHDLHVTFKQPIFIARTCSGVALTEVCLNGSHAYPRFRSVR